jgi:hypothetical protein
MAGKYTTIPLYRRPYDLLFVLIFGLSIWIALFFDCTLYRTCTLR